MRHRSLDDYLDMADDLRKDRRENPETPPSKPLTIAEQVEQLPGYSFGVVEGKPGMYRDTTGKPEYVERSAVLDLLRRSE